MKLLWTLVKVAVGLIVLIPVSLLMLGLFGTVLGLAMLLLRVAFIGLLVYGAFKVVGRIFRGPKKVEQPVTPRLAPADPYFQAAMIELDQELPEARARR
jgi:hypothetical protein